jgi:hypothetical protein
MNKEVYRQSPDCILEDMGEEALLYHPVTTAAIQLNASSLLIWQLCDGINSVDDIVETIVESYPGQHSLISEDVLDVVGKLLDSQALELVR